MIGDSNLIPICEFPIIKSRGARLLCPLDISKYIELPLA